MRITTRRRNSKATKKRKNNKRGKKTRRRIKGGGEFVEYTTTFKILSHQLRLKILISTFLKLKINVGEPEVLMWRALKYEQDEMTTIESALVNTSKTQNVNIPISELHEYCSISVGGKDLVDDITQKEYKLLKDNTSNDSETDLEPVTEENQAKLENDGITNDDKESTATSVYTEPTGQNDIQLTEENQVTFEDGAVYKLTEGDIGYIREALKDFKNFTEKTQGLLQVLCEGKITGQDSKHTDSVPSPHIS